MSDGVSENMKLKKINIVVSGEPTYIKNLINCISYGPDDSISHSFQVKGSDTPQKVKMNFGSLQVDENHRIDFFGGNDDALFDFINALPESSLSGLIVMLNADDSIALDGFNQVLLKHQQYLLKHALVVAVSGNDYALIKQAEEQVRQALRDLDTVAPVFSIDPENKEDVSLLIESLLCSARPGINDTSRGKSTFEAGQ